MAVEVMEAVEKTFAVFFNIWPNGGKLWDVSDFCHAKYQYLTLFSESAPRNRHKHETLQDEEGKLIARLSILYQNDDTV